MLVNNILKFSVLVLTFDSKDVYHVGIFGDFLDLYESL